MEGKTKPGSIFGAVVIGLLLLCIATFFVFSPTTISIDGAAVGPLDASVTDVRIDASYWSASLRMNGHEVSQLR